MTLADILRELPDLTEKDIRACLAFAADRERKLQRLRVESFCLLKVCPARTSLDVSTARAHYSELHF